MVSNKDYRKVGVLQQGCVCHSTPPMSASNKTYDVHIHNVHLRGSPSSLGSTLCLHVCTSINAIRGGLTAVNGIAKRVAGHEVGLGSACHSREHLALAHRVFPRWQLDHLGSCSTPAIAWSVLLCLPGSLHPLFWLESSTFVCLTWVFSKVCHRQADTACPIPAALALLRVS